jgi:predicted small secreted protein
MRKRLIALLLLIVVSLVAACSNTVEGLGDDAERNLDEAEQELNEEDNEG